MNVNGSRFQLLLGAHDWGRCRVVDQDGSERRLAGWWSAPPVASPANDESATLEPAPLTWDALRQELRLQRQSIALADTPGEAPLTLDARRSAAADKNGNIYWIDADPRRLRVRSVGSERESAFWPDSGPNGAWRGSDFGPLSAAIQDLPHYQALAVTEDHYLVVAFSGAAASGLLAFDLVGGGPPQETLWPAGLVIAPFAMIPRRGGGVWILDRPTGGPSPRLWELDRRLALVQRHAGTAPAAAEPELFQPPAGPRRTRPVGAAPAGIDLGALGIGDPIAVAAQGRSTLLILDRQGPAGPSRIYRLAFRAGAWRAEGPVPLRHLAHDCVFAHAAVRDAQAAGPLLLVATASGNQALAFAVGAESDPFGLYGAVELFPLRRYGGRALLQVQGAAWYDSGGPGPRWVPVVQQPRLRYREDAVLISPVLDGADLQCVWDRVLLDACCPADCGIEVWCRTADEAIALGTEQEGLAGSWGLQPEPRLRTEGMELPWLRAGAQRATRRGSGTGTWELLIQGQRGRYLQLRLRLSGNGTATPWLRALRCWYPRLSYPVRYLPAVYREDAGAGDFLERFLANMEGVNTELEGRIAQSQALLDPRCAPSETLDWLASWFDLALDPAWEERRRRLFIAHAMDFFRWRGTVHGLRLALALTFDPCLDPDLFAGPAGNDGPPQGIRIVETYQTRVIGALAAGDPEAADAGPRLVQTTGGLWSPAEGAGRLAERHAQAVLGRPATAAEQLRPFALFGPTDPAWPAALSQQQQAAWADFCQTNLGFVPTAGAGERRRWQAFLRSRYPDSAALAQAHGRTDAGWDAIDLPPDWPEQGAQANDWRAYCNLPEPTRRRWQDFLARRYRRIERLRAAHQTTWPDFALIPLPDHCPGTAAAQTDWLQFERHLLGILRTAHRFSVLLPVASVTADPDEQTRRLGLARRIVELEKPAHTVFDVRFYWSLNRIGEARLGLDTLLGAGSRAPELIPDAILGRAYLGAGFVVGPPAPADGDRLLIAC